MSTPRLLALLLALSLGGACVTEDHYIGEEPLHSFAITNQTPPFFEGPEGGALYLVETRAELPLIPPTEEDLGGLAADVEGRMLPYDRMPWVRLGDLSIEVDWALTNLTERTIRAAVVLNGFSEFHEYQPAFVVDDDDVIPDFSQWERDHAIGPFETRTGTVRIEEMDEMAIDLATIANGAPNPNTVVHFESQSGHDPRVAPYIPQVIAGLVGFRLGVRATAFPDVCDAGVECGLLVLEASIRVRDHEGRLAVGNRTPWELPPPAVISSRPAAEPAL